MTSDLPSLSASENDAATTGWETFGGQPETAATRHTDTDAPAGAGQARTITRGDVRSLGGLVQKVRLWMNARFYFRKATSVGRWAKVEGRPVVHNWGTMHIGERVLFTSTIVRSEFVAYTDGTLDIGARTFINYGCSIAAHERISIGADCLIGPYVNIIDNEYHSLHDRKLVPPSRPVTIGNNVWIGTRVIILPGVTIGDDAVIGAGAIVTKDVPPRSIAAGNPARVLRTF